MRKSLYYLLLIICSIISLPSFADGGNARSHIRSGNRDMRAANQESASKAEVKYRKALAADPSNTQAMYNLGCALLAQNKDSLAMEMFQKASTSETSKKRRAMSFHNMGVIMQRQQQYGQAIDFYKQALRLMPHDDETRYNLVLCQRQQKNNQNNQNNQDNKNKDNKNKDQNKDKNKDQDQNKDKDSQNKKDQQKKQQNQQQMSKENAEQLLNAAMQNEKATQQRMKKAMAKSQRRTLQKNW